MEIKRGEIYMADLSPVYGSEQGGVRPVLVVQNDVGNKFSPTVIVVAITSKLHKAKLPTHIEIKENTANLEKDSILLCEQIRTLDKLRLKEKKGTLDSSFMKSVDKAIAISLALNLN
ncbi:MAG: type II toxin-antitoxin system PemK/MazF family toxin [Clostridia bacterium]|nr:type II toxin-antitoxin system PemK/MazF family toxin [Clostridia bacterium]